MVRDDRSENTVKVAFISKGSNSFVMLSNTVATSHETKVN